MFYMQKNKIHLADESSMKTLIHIKIILLLVRDLNQITNIFSQKHMS